MGPPDRRPSDSSTLAKGPITWPAGDKFWRRRSKMLRWPFKALRIAGDIRAASRGPSALGKRLMRRAAYRAVWKVIR